MKKTLLLKSNVYLNFCFYSNHSKLEMLLEFELLRIDYIFILSLKCNNVLSNNWKILVQLCL